MGDCLAVGVRVGSRGVDGLGGSGDLGSGVGEADLRGGEGVVVPSSPPPPAGRFEVAFGSSQVSVGVGEVGLVVSDLGFGSGEEVAGVRREAGFEGPELFDGGPSGLAEPFDAEGEGVALARGRHDCRGPVACELVVYRGDPLDPPAVLDHPRLVGFDGRLDPLDLGRCSPTGRFGRLQPLSGVTASELRFCGGRWGTRTLDLSRV
ncbi:MAG: hypothetical protein M3P34_00110, partial [Actinomycetota bacterium]|nr:hypothetical protein [Actinomycetota bacterium]